MAKETRRLGRGLSSLIRTTTSEVSEHESQATEAREGRSAVPGDTIAPVGEAPSLTPSQSGGPVQVNPPRVDEGGQAPTATFVPSVASQIISDRAAPGIGELGGGSDGVYGRTVLPVGRIVANRNQPRQQFDAQAIAALAGSIARSGLVQPIVVRPVQAGEDVPPDERRYEIVAGERRWRASKAAGLHEIPVIVRDLDDEHALELALIENIQREDLNAIDRAQAYAAYCRQFNLKPEDVARRLSEDRTTVINYMRLLDLPAAVKDLVSAGELSMGHARALLGIPDDDGRIHLAKSAVENQLSVRALEDIVRRRKGQDESAGPTGAESRSAGGMPAKPANVLDLENRLQQAVGTKVRIKEGRRKGHGKLVIEYYSLDDFDRIAGLLGLRDE